MLYLLERSLQLAGWNGGIPYWDWSAVAEDWWDSDVFNYFGEVDGRSSDNCITQGAFAIGEYTVSPYPTFGSSTRPFSGGNTTCLRRCGEKGTTLDEPGAIASAHLMATSYNGFRGDDTTGYHADGHVIPGGDGDSCDLGNFYCSPNDPIFYLHHAFMDKTWWKWQQICSEYQTDFEGYMVVSPADPSGTASASEVMDQWGGYTIADVLSTEGDVLCYTYTESGGDVTNFSPPTCPSGASPSLSWSFGSTSSTGTGDEGTDSATATATATSAGSSATSTADLTAQATWLADLIDSLYVITNNQALSVSSGVALGRRHAHPAADASYYVAPSSTAEGSGASSSSAAALADIVSDVYEDVASATAAVESAVSAVAGSVSAAAASSTATAAAVTYLSDSWKDEVHVLFAEDDTAGTVVNYDAAGNRSVTVPAACNVTLIASDRVMARCLAGSVNYTQDGPTSGSIVDSDDGAEYVWKAFFPGVEDPLAQTVALYNYSGVCVKAADECLTPPRQLTPEEAGRRHMVYDFYITGYNKLLEYYDQCNQDPDCGSVAVDNKKAYQTLGTWDHLSN
ncbi:hypothetical protein HK405_013891 [Cladochytrium tenue]|nr:hypothetical protein HK405_013891 [Cladochytrium tenue]